MPREPERGLHEEGDGAGVAAEFNWVCAEVMLTSITAHRDWDSDLSQERDYTNADILNRNRGDYQNQFKTFSTKPK